MENNFFDDISSYITVFSRMHDVKNYHLERGNYGSKLLLSTAPQILMKNYSTEELVVNLKEELKNYIIHFKELYSEDYLQILYNNLTTLKYNEQLSKKFMLGNIVGGLFGQGVTTGYYDPKKNAISILSREQQKKLLFLMVNPNETYEETIRNLLPHELFHLATAINGQDTFYCGFRQTTSKYDVGEGINEGYTELLARRHFLIEEKNYSKLVVIVSLIEEIVGSEEMEYDYFHANLPGLIKRLAFYSNPEMAKDFILDIDFYNAFDKKETFDNIIVFILNAYRNKLLKDESIDPETVDLLLVQYQEHIESKFNKLEEKAKTK